MTHLLHVDGTLWEGCWPQPCNASAWSVGGYGPRSIGSVSGILGESWAQGSLKGAVSTLLATTNVSRDSVLLLSDVPNCDTYASAPCSLSATNVTTDVQTWLAWLAELQLPSWGVWNWKDGGALDSNVYGSVWANDTLTTKGRLFCEAAAALTNETGQSVCSGPIALP
jgi:hypothetical protein